MNEHNKPSPKVKLAQLSKLSAKIVMIDSHCHLALPEFDADWREALQRAQQQGVKAAVIPATDCASWARIRKLCQQAEQEGLPALAGAAGLHPCFVHQQDDLAKLTEQLANNSNWLAIGEFGLDAIGGVLPMAEQIHLCEQQLRLANRFELPVILHVRKAHNELLTLLSRHKVCSGVIHAFSGSTELAKQYIRHGLKLGIGGTITYPRANKTRQTVAELPLGALVLETDAPDQPIYGFQGQRNEPSRLPMVLNALAELKQSTAEQLAPSLQANTLELFARLQKLDLHR